MSSQVSMDVPAEPIDPEDISEDTLPLTAVKRYFKAGSNICGLILVLAMLIFSQVVISGNDYFVNYWTQQEYKRVHTQESVPFTKTEYLAMYGCLILGVIFVSNS